MITRRANTPQLVSTPSRAVVPGGDAQDFMNGVATNIIHLQHKKLRYYGGAGPARVLAARPSPSGCVPASVCMPPCCAGGAAAAARAAPPTRAPARARQL